MKRLVTFLLVCAMPFSAFHYFENNRDTQIYASAESTVTVEGLCYEVTNGSAVLREVEDTSVTTITIPATVDGCKVTTIDNDVFFNCPNLTEILVEEENSNFYSEDGVLFNRGQSQLIAFPCAKSGEYTIPEGVKKICHSAFRNAKQLTAVTFPASLKDVDVFAFAYCTSLEEVNGAVPGIFGNQFIHCSSLKHLAFAEADAEDDTTIPLTELNLQGCKALETLVIPESRCLGGEITFSGCISLKEIHIAHLYFGSNIEIIQCDALQALTLDEECAYLRIESCGSLKQIESAGTTTSCKIMDCPVLQEIVVHGQCDRGITIGSCPALTTAKFYQDMPVTLERGNDLLTIYGTPQSTGIQEACEKYNVPFAVLDGFAVIGDSNCDGTIDILDVIALNKALLGNTVLTDLGRSNADVDGDGKTDSTDALNILKYVVKLIDSFDGC